MRPDVGVGKEAPEVQIELGGRTRTLRLDLGVLIDFEDATGIDLQDRSQDLAELEAKLQRPKNVGYLLWAMLLHEDPELEMRQVARWIHLGNMNELAETALGLYAADTDPTAPADEPEGEPDEGNP